jgi:exopolyphosphatase/guanosine-5'-triphosphate,3'-diphosphate pyrophosphatase
MSCRYAVVDVGSNTIKLTIAESSERNQFKKIFFKDFPSCLGHSMADNIIKPSALPDCYTALGEIAGHLHENKVDFKRCVATHALRAASNQAEIVGLIKEHTGFEIEVISGEEEARLSLLAVMMDTNDEDGFACLNIGGGSTELGVRLAAGEKLLVFGFGAANLFSDFIKGEKVIDQSIQKISEFITEELKKRIDFSLTEIETIYAMGGSVFNAGYLFKKDATRNFQGLSNLKIPRANLLSILNELKTLDDTQSSLPPGMDARRLQTTLPGVLIAYDLLEFMKKDELTISTRSISDGIIHEMARQQPL